MGKFVLAIGLVQGDEHLCNTCYLFDRAKGSCGAKVKLDLLSATKDSAGRTLNLRPKECPLVPVDKWPGEENNSQGSFSLC